MSSIERVVNGAVTLGTTSSAWTSADAAELDVLLFELATRFERHRPTCPHYQPCPVLAAYREHEEQCRICEGLAPLTYGWVCEERQTFVAHGADCAPCAPCPHLREAIDLVLGWRDARVLLSKAELLRDLQDRQDAA